MFPDKLRSDKSVAQEPTSNGSLGDQVVPNEHGAVKGLLQEQTQHLNH